MHDCLFFLSPFNMIFRVNEGRKVVSNISLAIKAVKYINTCINFITHIGCG